MLWMWRKTVLKQASKLVPKTNDTAKAIQIDSVVEGGGHLELTVDGEVEVIENQRPNAETNAAAVNSILGTAPAPQSENDAPQMVDHILCKKMAFVNAVDGQITVKKGEQLAPDENEPNCFRYYDKLVAFEALIGPDAPQGCFEAVYKQ
jgi:hypothetical protein